MQTLSNTGYPRNLAYMVKRLNGYSRNTFKLMSLNQNQATQQNIITVDLPSNSMVDLSTLTMYFNLTTTTTAGFCAPAKNIEALIERVEVEINGQIINGGCNYYNQLWNTIVDTSFGQDVTNRRSVLQNGGFQPIPTANITSQQFAIQNWLGFVGSVAPNVISTDLLGNVRLRITLTSPATLISTAAATGQGFSLSNIYFSVDTVDIADGMFHQLQQQYLAQGGVFELPYKNYFSFTNSVNSMSQTSKFSLATQSLNRVWAMFVPGNQQILVTSGTTSGSPGAYWDPISQNSSYFTRVGNTAVTYCNTGNTNSTVMNYNLTNTQLSVNNVFFPNYQVDPSFGYANMLNSYGMSQDTLGGGNPQLNSLVRWNGSFWVAEQRFDHGSDGVQLISGIDCRGTTAQAYFISTGSITQGAVVGAGAGPGSALTVLLFAECTSCLRVGAGRQIEVVL